MVKTVPRHLWKDEEFRTCVPGPLSPDSPVFPPPPEGRTYVGWYGGHRGPSGGGSPQPSKFAIPCPWAAACGPSCGAEARCLLARRQGAEAGETVPVVDLDKYLKLFLELHLESIVGPAQREQERARFFNPDKKMKRIMDMADQDLARIMSKLTWGMLYSTYPKTPGPLNVLQTHLERFHGGRLPPQLAELKPGTTVDAIKPWKPPGAADAEGGAAKRPRKTVTVTTDNSEEDDEEEEVEEDDEEEEVEEEDEDEGQLESSGGEDSLEDDDDDEEEDEEEEGSEDEQGDEEEQDKVPAGTGAYGRAGRALPVAAPPSGRRQGSAKRPAVATTAPAATAAKANGGGEPRRIASPAPAARPPGARGEQGRGPEPGGQAAADAERKRREAAESVLEAAQRRAAALEQELAAAVNEAAAERRQRRKAAAEAEQSARDLAEQLAAAEAAADEAQAQAAEEAEARDAAEERLAAAQAEVEAERGLRRVVEAQLGQERARVRMLTQAARQGGQGGAGAE
ncbi:hypothetical protein HYH03_015832 [Edaphochlamys debaryana]|uniref:Uncharacterized protein n=1 Tax=Edaphochlamys debaryana TaxID=47281 RepID=A0A836BS39_9CHLO|nr:hypothetical protein HYH03_015832 [Edaphochlamys debaryana]|eukprot:KAG2485454.1 hypothetical protein HYH03_015832 [Edaphochlamys debaryana]